ncbi:MAG: type II toxin-antitoxin system PemK/MazF family toxin [Armatimonadetes bacterium]|nr:type II toxin-antitoxin system PemK/MazF family toxin [Armatimonadota bacterium]
MRRGEMYRVDHPGGGDPRRSRVFVVVSRQALIDSKYSTVICAPVYSAYHGLATQVPLGVDDGLKQDCSVHCDNLVSLQKTALTNFVATLSAEKTQLLERALTVALDLPDAL